LEHKPKTKRHAILSEKDGKIVASKYVKGFLIDINGELIGILTNDDEALTITLTDDNYDSAFVLTFDRRAKQWVTGIEKLKKNEGKVYRLVLTEIWEEALLKILKKLKK